MLKEILSISGKPGLYKLVSQGKNMLVVESLLDGKRMPSYSRDKVVSLSDIAIFTETEEVPLRQVLNNIKTKENGGQCPVEAKADNAALKKYMAEILPDYDKDRVYPSDMRKLFNWYNILVKSGMSDFDEVKETVETAE
ncbi:MAG: DUF5606 domain-containing protein [Paludibacter sp.]|nr:DUF5606 domain-containing protein [Paludibacter sp.]